MSMSDGIFEIEMEFIGSLMNDRIHKIGATSLNSVANDFNRFFLLRVG